MSADLEERIKALERRKEMSDALNKAASIFLSNTSETFDNMMTAGISLIAGMADIDRLNVWRNFPGSDGLHTSQIYRWDKESGGTTPPFSELNGLSYSKTMPLWEKTLQNGELINGPVRLVPEGYLFKKYGTVSVLITPIFLKRNFWGFVIFSDQRNERHFDDESSEMLRSAAFLCVNAIIRKEMEHELTQTQKFYQTITKSAPFGITIFDKDINIIDCNEEILKICNTDKKNYIENFYKFSTDFQPNGKKSGEEALRLMKQVIKTKEPIVVEWLHQNSAGEPVPCEITVICIERDGQYTGLAFAYDLRKIKKMEKEIARTAMINQAILDAMPVGLSIFTGNPPVISDCNAELTKMFNAPKQQILERYFEDFTEEYLPDGRSSLPEALSIIERASKGEDVRVEWPHRTADGESVPCELTQTNVLVDDELIILAFLYDLRNIKKMEKEFNRVARINQTILDNLPIGMAYFDGTPRITYVNDKLSQMFEAPKQTLVDRYYEDYSPEFLPDGRNATEAAHDNIKRAMAGEIVKFEWPHQTASGKPVHCDITLIRVKNEDEFIGIGFLYDLTKVKELTKNLEDALDRATAASEAKSFFLSNMSHEIRTPMNAIIGMTVIGKSADDIHRKDYCFEKIENASQHLLGVINDVLDMSKIEANKFELSNIEFDFEKMLQRVVNIIAFRADEKKQRLSVYIDKSIPRSLIGDDQRLAQVITNLLGNAVKFTSEGGSVKLETRFIGKENGVYTIQITVKDDGIGISAEQQQLLFHSFQQAESGTARRFGGTGLGLVISKNIVELMGGNIIIESDVGKGSAFSFTFKARRGSKNASVLSEIGINWDNVKIMAVDDDQEILDYFKEIMNGFGTTCDTAINAQEALNLIAKNGMYEIFFVDWKMPEMDGIMLAKELKSKSKSPKHTVVIMMSAAEWSTIADNAKNAGVDRFLSKPLFPSAIADAIAESIGVDFRKNKEVTGNDEIFKGYKILLAEDVDINREIVEALVEPTHLDVDYAFNGVEAVEMFNESPGEYDLILMDVQMPEMDGYEATRLIREIENNSIENSDTSFAEGETRRYPRKRIPIIAMTANVFREDIEKCINAGMNDHIGKPLDIDEFFIILRKYLHSGNSKT